jgi:hypothetical protein
VRPPAADQVRRRLRNWFDQDPDQPIGHAAKSRGVSGQEHTAARADSRGHGGVDVVLGTPVGAGNRSQIWRANCRFVNCKAGLSAQVGIDNPIVGTASILLGEYGCENHHFCTTSGGAPERCPDGSLRRRRPAGQFRERRRIKDEDGQDNSCRKRSTTSWSGSPSCSSSRSRNRISAARTSRR